MKIVRKNTPKKLSVAPYVRVSVKEPDDSASTPRVYLSKISKKELGEGLYIPTQERFFRNPPDDDPSQELFILEDWLRQKDVVGRIRAKLCPQGRPRK